MRQRHVVIHTHLRRDIAKAASRLHIHPFEMDFRKKRGRRRPAWKRANELMAYWDTSTEADTSADEAGTATQPMRSMNLNAFGSQPTSRQTPRLQNTNKTGLGNGAGAGWGGFGIPSSGGAFGGLGGAPGLGQGRPGQLSGFAQVMGGGGGQGPIDMR